MDKSQLRRLALDYADGLIGAGDYREQRRALIDGIVSGHSMIERVPSSTAGSSMRAAPPAAALPARNVPTIKLLLGAGAAACVAILLALLFWPAGEPVPSSTQAVPRVPVVGLPPARTLVESFVARRDFEADAIAAFMQSWQGLSESDRDRARHALWFSSLVRALRDEIKTQKALAGLAGGESAMERARRVRDLGERLGFADQLPDLDVPAPVQAAAATPAASTAPAPVAATPAPAPAAAAPPDRGEPTGRQWLAAQDDAQLTLQLFAVNRLDQVEKLMAQHPDLSVRVLASDGASPRYRVFFGVFADADAARSAFEALPDSITGATGGAIVKSFAAVRDDLSSSPAAATDQSPAPARPSPTPAPAPAAATPAAPESGYTLQLFASGSRANARALLRSFPDLGLELRELADGPAPYRVVFGNFESLDAARAARSQLPAALLSSVGEPIAKPIARSGVKVEP